MLVYHKFAVRQPFPGEGLALLTSPMALPPSLTPEKVRALLDTARTMYDYILIDSRDVHGINTSLELAYRIFMMGTLFPSSRWAMFQQARAAPAPWPEPPWSTRT